MIWGIVNKVVMLLLPFINRTALVYLLGISYLGLDSLFVSILQMLNMAELGFSSAVVFSMYKPIAEENYTEINALLRLYRAIYHIIGFVVLAVGVVLIPLLPRLVKSDLPDGLNLVGLYMIYLANTVLGYWLFAYKKSLFSAYQREDIISNINSVVITIKTIFQIILVYIFRLYYLYILVLPITTVIENLIVVYYAKRFFPECIPCGNVSIDVKKDVQKNVYGLMVQKVCETSRNSLDSIVISYFVGLNSVSLYGNYYYIMIGVHTILRTITKAITAGVGNSVVKETIEKNHSDMLKINFIYMWLASVAAICLLCTYQPFMKLWMGEKGMFGLDVVIAFSIYFYALCIGSVRAVYTAATGLWYEGRYRAVLEAVLNLILNILFGKYFGIIGIIMATVITIVLINFGYGSSIIYSYYFRNQKVHIYYLYQLYFSVITGAVGTICYRLCARFQGSSIVQIVGNVMICVVASNCSLWIAYCKLPVYREAKKMVMNILRQYQVKISQ